MDSYMALIMIFGGNFEIKYWAFCNGQIMSIAQNSALFSLIGTTYGGNGVNTFALPDLRGRTPVGMGQGPGLSYITLGEISGTENTTLLSTQMPAHTHQASTSGLIVTPSASTAAATSNTPGPTMVPAVLPVVGGGPSAASIKGYAVKDNTTTLAADAVTGSITIGQAGGSQPFSIRNPYLGVNYLIVLQGIFPPRN